MSTGELAVRAMEPDDREPVKEQHRACFPDEMALDELVLDNLFRHPYGINLVALREDRRVGYAGAIHGARPQARLLTIHTDPQARRSGVATALLDDLEHRLQARKAESLRLEVHAENEAAIELYRERGFETVRRDPAAYPNADPSEGLVMEKRIDAAPRATKD